MLLSGCQCSLYRTELHTQAHYTLSNVETECVYIKLSSNCELQETINQLVNSIVYFMSVSRTSTVKLTLSDGDHLTDKTGLDNTVILSI